MSLNELKEVLGSLIEEKIKAVFAFTPDKKSKSQERFATRKEVSERLRISLPTLNNLTKQGIAKSYRIGGRVLYKWDEIEAVLTVVSTTKYKRKDFLSK